jgi:hypothetical protein
MEYQLNKALAKIDSLQTALAKKLLTYFDATSIQAEYGKPVEDMSVEELVAALP